MERFLRLISPFGINEVAYTIAPWWFAGLFVYWFWRVRWLEVLVDIGLGYILMAGVVSQIAGWWSRHALGLRRYIVVPIPRWVAVALVRGRMSLPRGQRYFLLHVRVDSGLNPRRMAREMRNDVQRAVESDWTSGAVFLGNTFGSLGMRQKNLLEFYGEVVAVPGTFLPGQTLLMSPKKYQRKMFGRRFGKGKWQIVRFQTREREQYVEKTRDQRRISGT